MNIKFAVAICAALVAGAGIAILLEGALRGSSSKIESAGAKYYGRIHGKSFAATVDMTHAVPWNGTDPLSVSSNAAAALARKAVATDIASEISSWRLEYVNLTHIEGRYFYVVSFGPISWKSVGDSLDSYPVIVYFDGTAQPPLPTSPAA